MQMLGESAGVGPLVGDVDRHRKGRRAKSEDGEEQVRRLR